MKFDLKMKIILFVVIVFGGLFWYNSTSIPSGVVAKPQENSSQQNSTQAKPVGEQKAPDAPPFTLKNINGGEVSLADYKGKVVFVNFWATWCPPCRAEIPHFVELIDKYGKDGFVILGISVDDQKDHKKIPAFMKKYKINYPILLDDNKTRFDYGGIRSIPTTFVIDREGKVLGNIVGSRSKEQFEDIIKQVL
jgi:cytochrome c-type biogenesis protein